ncbi:hypothetical protein DB346_23890 [Verrucomicrobia bacterium LW23]|nr:hypothetical protein DB346_23890 [Verrucomicrobia bacterium LW23]
MTRRREQIPFLATLAVWLVLIASVEGFHAISTELLRYSDVLYRWGVTIAELRSLNFTTYCLYLTPAALLFPFLVVRCFILREATSVWARLTAIQWYVVAIAVLTVGLAIWQQRWFPYASMALIFFFAMWLSMETGWVWRTAFTLFFLYGTATATEAALRAQSTPLVGEVMQITRTIAAIRAQDGAPQPFKLGVPLLAQRRAPADFRGIVAPWWASPMLLYRTRQPIVASSSHSSISGILDSAAFFCAASWGEADEILVRRKARWIVVYDPQLVLPELYKVLYGTDRNLWPPMDQALVGNALWNATGVQPSRFKLRSILRNTRVYEYLGPPPPLPEPARPATGDDVQKDTKAPPKWDPNTRMPDVPEMPPLPPVPEEPATNDMR